MIMTMMEYDEVIVQSTTKTMSMRHCNDNMLIAYVYDIPFLEPFYGFH